MEWSFGLVLDRPLTRGQADGFDHCDAQADGAISHVLAPEDPGAHPRAADPAVLRELACDIEAPTPLDAVADAVQRVRLVDGVRAVGVTLPGAVTLDEAARRSGRSAESPARLAQDPGFPEPEPEPEPGDGTALYAWDRVAAFLRGLGEAVPDVPRDLVIAQRALGLAGALDGADVSPGTLRALGLPVG